MKYEITVLEAYDALAPVYDSRNAKKASRKANKAEFITAFYCLEAAKKVYQVTFKQLNGPSGAHRITRARAGAAWFLRKKTNLTYAQIGKIFNRHFQFAWRSNSQFDSLDPNIRAEKDELLKAYNLLVRREYDKDIPF